MAAYLPQADDGKQAMAEFFAQNGQQVLPIMELLIDAKRQLHDFTHAVGVAAIEGLLELSATQLAGPPHPGQAAPPPAGSAHGPVRRHGHQPGVVCMGRSKLRVQRPRLRTVPDAQGQTIEVEAPAYTALKHDPKLSRRIMDVALGGGVSTRKYRKTLEQTADAVGVSKSAVSRALKKAMTTALEELGARTIPGGEILAVYIDGFVVGSSHVIGAIGVKKDGAQMVLGVREGSGENLTVVTALLTDLRERGLTSDVLRLFVLDGGKALASAVDGVYGDRAIIQRCRNHKVRNVLDHRVQGKAVFQMKGGLSWSGDRTWPQTSPNCGGQEPSWETSGVKGATRSRQVRSTKSNASEPLMTYRNRLLTSKPGSGDGPGISMGGACNLAHAASGTKVARAWIRLEHGTLEPVALMPRKKPKRTTREGESTNARHRGGTTRSSVEGRVMRLERRGRVIQSSGNGSTVQAGGTHG